MEVTMFGLRERFTGAGAQADLLSTATTGLKQGGPGTYLIWPACTVDDGTFTVTNKGGTPFNVSKMPTDNGTLPETKANERLPFVVQAPLETPTIDVVAGTLWAADVVKVE